ncbi:hypothetical protein [Serratia marcescens]|uniref:hypothetical protein n=1 Tax=Serratia marcescens TaxID=615 RepID=UPI0038C8D572
MAIISVEANELGQEIAAWGVPHNYAMLFLSKSTVKNNRVALHPFFFNDTEHMTSPRHWLALNAAPWSSVNNCTEGEVRGRLKLELHQRGFNGSDMEVTILMRGSGLRFGQGSLIFRNGRLRERRNQPEDEIWPGWS